MLPIKNMVDPRRGFSGSAMTSDKSSKPARRKQWIGGFNVPAAFHDALWHGMKVPENAAVMWLDLFAYDHSVIEALMRRACGPVASPRPLYVGIVWAASNTRDYQHKTEDAQVVATRGQNAKIAKWLQSSIRRKLQTLAQEKVPDWQALTPWKEMRAPPTLEEKDYLASFPSASESLPLKESFRRTSRRMTSCVSSGQRL